MAGYLTGNEYDFLDFTAEASLPVNYELETEMIKSRVRETEDTIVFRLTPGGSVLCKPCILDGVVYFTSCDGNVYAVDLETGRELWRFHTNGPIVSRVATGHGRIYSTSYDGNLYCLDMKGNLVWKFDAGDRIAAPPIVHDDRIYFGCRDGNLYAVDKRGRLAWKFRTDGPIGSQAKIYNGRIYFGSLDYSVYAADLEGRLVWRFRTGNQVGGPVASNGVIYFGSFDQNLYAVDEDGRLLWKFMTGDAIPVGTAVSAFGDTVYFCSRDYNVYAVRKGRLSWKFRTGDMVFSEVIEEGDKVYFCSGDGNLYVVDKENGKELMRFSSNGPAMFPNKSGKMILFSSHDCNVYAVSETGGLLWKFHTSLNNPSDIEEAPGVEYTVIVPSPTVRHGKSSKSRGERALGDYGEFRGSYIQNDMRDYMGGSLERGGPRMTYKSGSKVYRK